MGNVTKSSVTIELIIDYSLNNIINMSHNIYKNVDITPHQVA